MKICVLGDGLLGSEIINQTGWDYISRKKNKFNISHPNTFHHYFIEDFDGIAFANRYDIIINCIAYTNTYSDNKELHWNINYKGVADLVDFCNKWKIKLVHISTDYVYTNSVSNASENDIPIHGNNWYSYTKLLADSYIELRSNNYLICRETHKPYPFPYNEAWIDQVGNFDYVNIIAENIINLINTNASGIFNIGTKPKTMHELALKTHSGVIPALKPSYTPHNTTLNTDKLNKWLLENL